MNVSDITKEIARREAMAAAWAASAKGLREGLDAKARSQYEQDKTGVTWKVPDIGRVTLPLSEEAVTVSDIDALLKWTEARHPENVETVKQVRAAFQTWLTQNATITEDGLVVDPDTGEVIPGLGVREGGQPKALSITVTPTAKKLFANYATQQVAAALAAEYGEAVPDAA